MRQARCTLSLIATSTQERGPSFISGRGTLGLTEVNHVPDARRRGLAGPEFECHSHWRRRCRHWATQPSGTPVRLPTEAGGPSWCFCGRPRREGAPQGTSWRARDFLLPVKSPGKLQRCTRQKDEKWISFTRIKLKLFRKLRKSYKGQYLFHC